MILAVALVATPSIARDWGDQETPFLNNGVTAHRGFSVRYPENTIRAFSAGIAVGADWLECDVFKTKDGKLVVIHDATTGRVGDRDVRVNDASWDDLRTVDVAHAFRRKHGLSPENCPPERIPLLSELIGLVMRQEKTRLSIQPKDGSTSDILALIDRMKAARWVGFNDGDLNKMRLAKEFSPAMPVFWDRPAETNLEADIQIARRYGFEALVIQDRGVIPEKVAALHAAGIEAGAWTVNDAPRMERLLKMGVDRIYTDDPALLFEVKKQLHGNNETKRDQ
jgi:glycerophosphoryl diester phosphodiesterase